MTLRALFAALAIAASAPQFALAQASVAQQRAAAPQPQSGEILVMLRMPAPHYRPNAQYGGKYDDRAAMAARRRVASEIARENGLELGEGWPMPLLGVDCYRMRVPPTMPIEGVIAQVSRHRMVAWAQTVESYDSLASAAPSADPLFGVEPAASEWQLAELHRLATGRGITIAVIDSAIAVNHPDLAGQFAANRNFIGGAPQVGETHGTAVAGVISAKPGNGIGMVGVAPGAKLLALRACSERDRRAAEPVSTCDSLTLAKALEFAIERRADIINMSLSGPPDRLLASLVGIGLKRSISIVAAFDPARPGGGFPASIDGVYPVAEESLATVPERVYRAPGRDIPTTEPDGRWYLVNGSSFAAAHVSGLLALAKEQGAFGALPAGIARQSGGLVDACATLVRVTRECRCSCAITKSLATRKK